MVNNLIRRRLKIRSWSINSFALAWLIALISQGTVIAQVSTGYNYVITNSIRKANVTDVSQIVALTPDELQQSISYLDGRGRTMQEIKIQGSPLRQDVIVISSYDNLGRKSLNYLPYASGNTGAFKAAAVTSQNSFYQSLKSDTRPFTETKFENSPAGRITEIMPQGIQWYNSNKKLTRSYSTNTATEVRLWNFNISTKSAVSTSTYPANSLSKVTYKDEDDFLTVEFQDKSGKVVCKQSARTGFPFNTTYYIYDDYGSLRFVVPPEAVNNLPAVSFAFTFNDSFCKKWLFGYDYDKQLRPVVKTVPGAGLTYMVYDPLNRVVLEQDQKMRTSNQWIFSKYDIFERTIMSGVYRHATAATQTEMQNVVDNFYLTDPNRKSYEVRSSTDFTSLHGYSNQSFPVIPSPNNDTGKPFQVSYYDDYDFDNNGVSAETAKGEPAFINFGGNFAPANLNNIRGAATGTRILVLGTSTWLTSAVYYDSEGRTVQVQRENYSTGPRNVDVTAFEYDFTGQVLSSELRHRTVISDNSFSVSVRERQTYDHAGRVLQKFVQINNEPEERIFSHSYNEISETGQKVIGSSTGIQSVDYKFNIRGWLSNINGSVGESGPADYYSEQLAYNVLHTGGTGVFDGKIKQAKWKLDLSAKERLFDFTYDDQNRLTAGVYKANSGAGWNSDLDLFSENSLTYDKNGNVKTLNRYSGSLTSNKIDELAYDYGSGGNQLMKVTDNAPSGFKALGFNDSNTGSDDYAYDENGNLTRDLNKQISRITYNLINLPDTVVFSNGSYIRYIYTINGDKLRQVYFNALSNTQKTTDYQDRFVYEDGVLQIIFHDEGRILGPSYTNLVSNMATSQANSLQGFSASGSVTLTNEVVTGQNYVKAVCNQSAGSPGVVSIGGAISVKPGERYAFKILGYQSVGSDAALVVKNAANSADILWPGSVLPVGQANETWVTSTFTIPAGVTQISVGVLWNSGALSKVFYLNEVKVYKLDYEFQYFLKDHLGSPRVILQTNPSTFTYTATMEAENFSSESSQFFNLVSSNEVVFAGANATPGGNEALSMNVNYRVGPARSFKVMPGDMIDASVMALYSAGTYTKTPLATMSAYVAAALTGGSASVVDGVNYSYSNSGGSNPAFLLSPSQGTNKPSAFLNYILFDDAYRAIEAKSAPLGASANVLHPVILPTIAVKEAGYLFIYLSYDNEAGGNNVFFDDLKIVYGESAVIQLNNYYPFGAVASLWARDGEFQNRYLYQQKEYDENLLLQDFHARLYDAYLARWTSVDPKGYARPEHSSYMAMGNNPLNNIDPNGEFFLGTLITAAIDLVKTAFFDGGLDPTSSGARREAWRAYDPTRQGTPTNNAFRIDKGLWATDPNLKFGRRLWQLVSRFSWELPTTAAGLVASHAVNLTKNIERVDYYAGATVLWNADKTNGGTTIGNYINIESWQRYTDGSKDRRPGYLGDYEHDGLFIHEYGHYVQARKVGGVITLLGGFNSILSTWFEKEGWFGIQHEDTWWEMDASARGLDYFKRTGRLDTKNPVDRRFIENEFIPNHPIRRGRFWDYLTMPFTWPYRY